MVPVNMNVDVVICTYNRSEKLKKVIQSILDAEVPENHRLQLIIVNNNSTDNTESIVKEFAGNDFVRINYLFESKQGKSHALNTGLKNIMGEIIGFTDDDVFVDRLWLKEMAAALTRYPEYSCFGGKTMAIYPAHLPGWLDTEGSMEFLRSAFVDRNDGDVEADYEANPFSKTPSGCNMFFRRCAIEFNGPFRTDLGPAGNESGFSEDTDYCTRLIERGKRFMYIPSAIVYHPVHENRIRKDYLLGWQYACGKSEVRRGRGYKDTVKVFGVPRYLIRKLSGHFTGWWLSLRSKKRFYHKLKLYYTCGEIVEHLRLKR
jgi:glycosyltransferase involved in cell wall biosynthesis